MNACTPRAVPTKAQRSTKGSKLLLHVLLLSAGKWPSSYLCILRLGNVHQRLCSRMDNIEELQDGGTVIGDSGFA